MAEEVRQENLPARENLNFFRDSSASVRTVSTAHKNLDDNDDSVKIGGLDVGGT
jgi:hypothetical protein